MARSNKRHSDFNVGDVFLHHYKDSCDVERSRFYFISNKFQYHKKSQYTFILNKVGDPSFKRIVKTQYLNDLITYQGSIHLPVQV